MGFDCVIPAISIGLSLISCVSTAILWVWQIRKLKVCEIFSHKQDDEGEFWIVGLAGRGR